MWRDFGAFLRQRRRALDLTQEAVAASVGITDVQYSRIETGASGTRRETVEAIASTLGLDRRETLERAGFSATEPGDQKTVIIAKIRALSDESVHYLEPYVEFMANREIAARGLPPPPRKRTDDLPTTPHPSPDEQAERERAEMIERVRRDAEATLAVERAQEERRNRSRRKKNTAA